MGVCIIRGGGGNFASVYLLLVRVFGGGETNFSRGYPLLGMRGGLSSDPP